jgi:hypothetical protein
MHGPVPHGSRAGILPLPPAPSFALAHDPVPVGHPRSDHYREDMDGNDAVPRTESTATATPAARDRGSGRGEALIMASWTLIGGLFMTAVLHFGPDLWGGALGPVIFGGLIVLVMLGNVTRARTRATRPRHFGLAAGMAALWLGMGGGIATQALDNDSVSGVPLGTAVIAAAVLTAPLLACSVWLAARSR